MPLMTLTESDTSVHLTVNPVIFGGCAGDGANGLANVTV
jgi:hypothetical protein